MRERVFTRHVCNAERQSSAFLSHTAFIILSNEGPSKKPKVAYIQPRGSETFGCSKPLPTGGFSNSADLRSRVKQPRAGLHLHPEPEPHHPPSARAPFRLQKHSAAPH